MKSSLPALRGLGLAGLLLAATLGEGGGHPVATLLWHGWLALLLCLTMVLPFPRSGGDWSRAGLLPFGLFLLLFALGVARAPYAYAALLVALELGCCIAALYLAASAGSGLLRLLGGILPFGAAMHGLYVVAQAWYHPGPRQAGSFLNANHMALWFVAVLLLGFGSREAWGGRTARLRNGLLILPAATAVVLSGSRGAAVALLAGCLTLLVFHWPAMPRRFRLALISALAVVLALLAWRQIARTGEPDPFRYQRVKIWSASLGAVAAEPWWGSGPGQFATVSAGLSFDDGDGPLRYDRAFAATHSDLVRLPAELGLPAAAVALVALGLLAFELRRRGRSGTLPDRAAGAIAALVSIAAHALVDNPSRWPSIYLLASVLVGGLVARSRRESSVYPAAWRRVAGIGVLVVFLIADLAPFLAWNTARSLPRGRLTPEAYTRLERALRLNPIQPDYWLRLAEHLSGEGPQWGMESYAGAREAAEHAVRLDPGAARFHRGVARVEARGCRTLFLDVSCRSVVERSYTRAERCAPFNPLIPVGLAIFLLETGDPFGARRAAERALALEPDSALPRLVLADALIEEGSSAGQGQAARLIGEARRIRDDQGRWNQSAYGRTLLVPEQRHFERLQRKLVEAGQP